MHSDDIDDSAWPHEMSLITSHNETVFTELLFIRDSWRLPTDDRLPDLAPPPRPTATTFSDSQLIAFTNGWHAAWERAVAWSLDAAARAQTVQSLLPGDTDALRAILPPRWTDALDDERFDHDAWSAWQQRLPRYSPTAFDVIPERRSLVALSPPGVAASRFLSFCRSPARIPDNSVRTGSCSHTSRTPPPSSSVHHSSASPQTRRRAA